MLSKRGNLVPIDEELDVIKIRIRRTVHVINQSKY